MPLLARAQPARDPLPAALCAAELGDPYDVGTLPPEALRELIAALPSLCRSVPFATLRLLGRLCSDGNDDARAAAARALAGFAASHPARVEELLLLLACDPARQVRRATVEPLAALLAVCDDPERLVAEWEYHPDRARAVLAGALRARAPRAR